MCWNLQCPHLGGCTQEDHVVVHAEVTHRTVCRPEGPRKQERLCPSMLEAKPDPRNMQT